MPNGTGDGPTLPGFDRFSFGHEGRQRYVFRAGKGPGVLLLHELPGMVPECVERREEVWQALLAFLHAQLD